MNFSLIAFICFALTSAGVAAAGAVLAEGPLKRITTTSGGLALCQSLIGIVLGTASFLSMAVA